jgi:hypothetical protein
MSAAIIDWLAPRETWSKEQTTCRFAPTNHWAAFFLGNRLGKSFDEI